jgi:hypothetical protein
MKSYFFPKVFSVYSFLYTDDFGIDEVLPKSFRNSYAVVTVTHVKLIFDLDDLYRREGISL